MVAYLKTHRSVRVMLVEKTDRLYRNLKDWVTVDELDVEMHFPKEGVVLYVARLVVECTDPLGVIDIPHLLRETGDRLLQHEVTNGLFRFHIERGKA
jgi:hypothetical protein